MTDRYDTMTTLELLSELRNRLGIGSEKKYENEKQNNGYQQR